MKEKTPRDLALMALNELPYKLTFSSQYLDHIFRDNPHLDDRDKAFINHLVQGVLRWRLRLDWIIEQAAHFPIKKITPPILNILRLALYQIFFLDKVPESAAVNEAVKQSKGYGARHVVSFVNGALRGICRGKDGIGFPDRDKDPVNHLSVFHSYPLWMVERWVKEFGIDFTESLLSAGNTPPLFTIRTNLLRVARPELIRRLEEEGVRGRPTAHSPEGIVLEGIKGRPEGLSAFSEGFFQVQDEAAQVTSHLLSPQPGESVLDICAGLGGKTTHLAQLAGDKGRVLALDISHRRLIGLHRSSERLGICSISSVVADASKDLSLLFPTRRFDKVLIDAPCSGLGVISRHPDGKWNRSAKDIARLAQLQKTMIDRAVPLLGEGGKMLYVTCTISREENEEVVNRALETHGDVSLENIKDHAPEWGHDLIDEGGFMKTFPHLHGMDGFFAALFVKR